jgi:hypothetical protein
MNPKVPKEDPDRAAREEAAALTPDERAELDALRAADQERANQPEVNVLDDDAVNATDDATRDRDPDLPEAVQARMDAPFYCPGCGRPFQYEGECTGASLASPHPPVQTVSTEELHGDDTEAHTAAPATEGV